MVPLVEWWQFRLFWMEIVMEHYLHCDPDAWDDLRQELESERARSWEAHAQVVRLEDELECQESALAYEAQEWITANNRIDALLYEMKACHADKEQLEARLKEAEGLLREYMWDAWNDKWHDGQGGYVCLECHGPAIESGHDPDCKLAAFLKGSV